MQLETRLLKAAFCLSLCFIAATAVAEDPPSVQYGFNGNSVVAKSVDEKHATCVSDTNYSSAQCDCAAREVLEKMGTLTTPGRVNPTSVGYMWDSKMRLECASGIETPVSGGAASRSSRDLTGPATSQIAPASVKPEQPETPEIIVSQSAATEEITDPLAKQIYDYCKTNRMADAYHSCECIAQTGLDRANIVLQRDGQYIVDRAQHDLDRATSPTYRQPTTVISQLEEDLNEKRQLLEAKNYSELGVRVSHTNLYSQVLSENVCKSKENSYRYELSQCQRGISVDRDCECYARSFADLWVASEATARAAKLTPLKTKASSMCR